MKGIIEGNLTDKRSYPESEGPIVRVAGVGLFLVFLLSSFIDISQVIACRVEGIGL